ncbi:hypothetical protein BDV96DRAFT_653272 [Lophiotrema nucula]|uniref:NACHT domain-containing protein n=1 Tax=Lophiotrema nucula TaxID=690887 RepID=A0A6A5YLS0_9PLEO|nr:hypothetical protein BDV96DRAFT_653272 [Lophiotrema nucula]
MSSHQTQIELIFTNAIARYEQKTKKQLPLSFASQLTTVQDLRRLVQKENADFKAFQAKDDKIYSALNKALTPIERLSHVAATGSSIGFPPAGVCFGAVALMIKSAQDVSGHYEKILELFDIIQVVVDQLELQQLQHASDQLKENIAKTLATMLELIAFSTKAIERRRFKEMLAKLFTGENEDLKGLHTQLKKHASSGKALIQIEVKNDTNMLKAHAEMIVDTTTRTDTKVDEVKDILRSIQDEKKRQQATNIRIILLPSESANNKMEEIRRYAVPGTGDWLFSEPAVQRWVHRDDPLLWIRGDPGTGKTYVAGSIVATLLSQMASGRGQWSNASVGFFFFSRESNTFATDGYCQAMKNAAWQIATVNPDYAAHVASQCHRQTDVAAVASAWRKLFTSYFGRQGRHLYLVLDGIDETVEDGDDGREEFLKLLPDLQDSSAAGISLLLVGRPHLTDSLKLAAYGRRTAKMATIHIDAQKNKADLLKYIDKRMVCVELGGASPDFTQHIRQTIESKSQGMFLWAKLMFEILSKQTTEEAMRKRLDDAPAAINDMITIVLKVYSSTLKAREPDEFNLILAWLACAARPLSLAEIAAVLSTLSPTGSKVLGLERRLKENFATLISLVRDDGLSVATLSEEETQVHGDSTTASTTFRSIPETTTVVFAHALIAEYFRAGHGRFSHSKTHKKIGVILDEAHLTIFRTCLDAFVKPSSGTTSDTIALLQPYSMSNWFVHLEGSCQAYVATDPFEKVDMVRKLHQFLFEKQTIRKWCREVAWSFYTEAKAKAIADWIQRWTETNFELIQDDSIKDWAASCTRQPANIFRPISMTNAEEGLGNYDWQPTEALLVVAHIKALTNDEDTLDILSHPVPLNTILAAVEWANLEQNASWHRNLAVCLRTLGYTSEAVSHFQTAISMEEEYTEARRGLAYVYDEQENFTKVVELESTNASILAKKCGDADPTGGDPHVAQELARTYHHLASAYESLGDVVNALRFWQKAIETKFCTNGAFLNYLALLRRSESELWYKDAMWALKTMRSMPDEPYPNLLVHQLSKLSWPSEDEGEFFNASTAAAVEIDMMPWLFEVYEDAISSSASHISITTLKLCLVHIHKRYLAQHREAESLIEDIIYVTSLDNGRTFRDLENCKNDVAQDFFKISIRRIVEATARGLPAEQYLRRMIRLCKSGLDPRKTSLKLYYAEQSDLYVALGQRLLGDVLSAETTVRPYIMESLTLISKTNIHDRKVGLLTLSNALMTIGRTDDSFDLKRYIVETMELVCDHCGKGIFGRASVCACLYCLETFCENCVIALEEPSHNKHCVLGHSRIAFSSQGARSVNDHQIVFRSAQHTIQRVVHILQGELGILGSNQDMDL